jgi:vacuolar-type H+-ATPase subunit H
MHRKATMTSLTILATILGCQDSADRELKAREEAREDVQEARRKSAEEVREADREFSKKLDEQQQEVDEARRELTEARGEAREKVAKAEAEAREKVARHPRFELIKTETRAEFALRAETTLTRLDKEIEDLTATAKHADEIEGLKEARAALAEARRDLIEVRAKSGGLLDDGRLGVTTAINETQRKIETVRERLEKRTNTM